MRSSLFGLALSVAGTFVISLLRSPGMLDEDLKGQHAVQVQELNKTLANERDLHRALEKDLRGQLEEPKICAEILEYQLEEVQGSAPFGMESLLGRENPLAGTPLGVFVDTVVKLRVRVGNEHRAASVVQEQQLVIYERFTWNPLRANEEPITDVTNYPRIELNSPIAFACPRFGWLFYRVQRKRREDLISGRLQLSVTDGTGKVSHAPPREIG